MLRNEKILIEGEARRFHLVRDTITAERIDVATVRLSADLRNWGRDVSLREFEVAIDNAQNLEYMVEDASWMPSYLVRVAREKEELALEVKAILGQETGEDWNGVAVTLVVHFLDLLRVVGGQAGEDEDADHRDREL